MGYVFCTSQCYGCKRLFTYNPNLVPSIRIDGEREPICQNCVDAANPERAKRGLDPIAVLPGAYEPCEESQL